MAYNNRNEWPLPQNNGPPPNIGFQKPKTDLEEKFETVREMQAVYNTGLGGISLITIKAFVNDIIQYSLKPAERAKIQLVDLRYIKLKEAHKADYDAVQMVYTSRRLKRLHNASLDYTYMRIAIDEAIQEIQLIIEEKSRVVK